MKIEDLLIDFDEMGFAPTTLCENPDEYAREWREQLVAEIERLKTENERFENNMKSVLEIEKENVRKETAKSIYEKAKFVVDITRDLMHGKKYLYLGVLKEIVNRLYDVEVEE